MEHLDQYQQRVQRMQASLERLLALHGQIYDLQGEIVALSKSDVPDRVERVKVLQAKVRALLPEIGRAKKSLTKPGQG